MVDSSFLCASGVVGDAAECAAAKPKRWGKSRPFHGQVVAVEGLCNLASGDDKDTIRVEIDLGESGLQYTPGDALGVYPLNCNQVCSAPSYQHTKQQFLCQMVCKLF